MARAAAATLGLLALHTSLPSAAAGGTGLADTYYVAGAATASGRYERLSVRCNSKPVYRQVGGGFALFDPAGRDTTWAIGRQPSRPNAATTHTVSIYRIHDHQVLPPPRHKLPAWHRVSRTLNVA